MALSVPGGSGSYCKTTMLSRFDSGFRLANLESINIARCSTNNLFQPECLQAAIDNALSALEGGLIAAGVDGVFLDGVTNFGTGCHSADVNCTSAHCKPTPPLNGTQLEAEWEGLFAAWFAALKAKHPKLLWSNNMGDDFEPALINISNGRQQEGSDPLGLDGVYAGEISIRERIALSREWSVQSLQPSYVHMSMNSEVVGAWRVGRWQNLVTRGEMMRLLTDFRRMRFGLGVTLMTDSYHSATYFLCPVTFPIHRHILRSRYFGNDVGGGWYGAPSWYTEYDADLGQAIADPVCVFSTPFQPPPWRGYHPPGWNGGSAEEVWTREFEFGFVVVSSIASRNFTVTLPRGKGLRPLPLSSRRDRITDQREAPAWQFVIDNEPAASGSSLSVGARNKWTPACACSSAAPACCPHVSGRPLDWWASDARRAGFRIVAGNWTSVSDSAQSHQVGNT